MKPWHVHQIGLFDDPIEAAWREYHQAHPEVYRELVALARKGVSAGRTKLGIAQLFEVLRWERDLASRDAEGFKINNNFASRYARLIMANEPDLAGIFNVRELHAA